MTSDDCQTDDDLEVTEEERVEEYAVSFDLPGEQDMSLKHFSLLAFTPVKSLNPFTPKISLLILLAVCHTILMMLVRRIWHWINH